MNNLIKEDNSKRKQGRAMVLVHCTSSQCTLSLWKFKQNLLNSFGVMLRTKV